MGCTGRSRSGHVPGPCCSAGVPYATPHCCAADQHRVVVQLHELSNIVALVGSNIDVSERRCGGRRGEQLRDCVLPAGGWTALSGGRQPGLRCKPSTCRMSS